MTETGERWATLRAYAELVATSSSVRALTEFTLTTALEALRADSVSISRLERERGRVKILHNLGDLAEWEDTWPDDRYYVLSDYSQLMNTVGGDQRSWRGSLDDPETDEPDKALLRRLGKTHAASFQVFVANHMWGDLYAARSGLDPFTEEDCAVGEVLVGLLSAGLSRLELLAELSRLAYTDGLTGLGNRRAADEWLDRKLVTVDELETVTVVLCDINGLKRVNDELGHAAGDELLRIAAAGITTAVEGLGDVLVARMGGDEFVVLLSGVAGHRVSTVEKSLADLSLPHGASLAVGAASTLGYQSDIVVPTTEAKALLRLADAAQYLHKRTHRLGTQPLRVAPFSIVVELPVSLVDLTDQAMKRLESMPSALPVERLQGVCNDVATAYEVASWWISKVERGVLFDVLGCVLRPDARGDLAGVELTSGTQFRPVDYPATLRALSGGSYYATLTEGDPAERATVARMGYLVSLGAGATDDDGTQWLVELFGDSQTSEGLFTAESALRALVHIAVKERVEV